MTTHNARLTNVFENQLILLDIVELLICFLLDGYIYPALLNNWKCPFHTSSSFVVEGWTHIGTDLLIIFLCFGWNNNCLLYDSCVDWQHYALCLLWDFAGMCTGLRIPGFSVRYAVQNGIFRKTVDRPKYRNSAVRYTTEKQDFYMENSKDLAIKPLFPVYYLFLWVSSYFLLTFFICILCYGCF